MTDDSIRELRVEKENGMLKEFINVWLRELAKVVTQFKFVPLSTFIWETKSRKLPLGKEGFLIPTGNYM